MNDEAYIFRPMQRADIDRVYELECLCFRTPWSRDSLKSELKNRLAHYQVMIVDGAVIGYAGMWVLFDEAHITNIAIDPGYRGRGFGKALMKQMISVAISSHATRMTLEVREHNETAQRLYFSLGFEKAGVRKRYYSDTGEDAWIMWNNSIKSD